jgi:hypothetical protein
MRQMRVRFIAVVVKANSAATFSRPRKRNRRIPRCSFNTPNTGSTIAFLLGIGLTYLLRHNEMILAYLAIE